MRRAPALLLALGLAACRPEAPRPVAPARAPAEAPVRPSADDVPEAYRLPSVQAQRPADAPPRPSTRVVPPPDAPPPSQDVGSADEAAVPFTEEEVYAYLAAISENDLGQMLRLYADRVRFYALGVVGKGRIRADKEHYIRRWPIREYSLIGDPRLSVRGNAATARFDYAFAVQGGGRHREGTGWTVLAYRFDGQEWKIVEERGGTY